MYQSDLDSIKNFILQSNSYFNTGYANVYQDEATGVIYGYDEEGNATGIFPDDSKGDYFYLRLPKSVSFDYNTRYKVSDCEAGLGLKTSVILVASVRNAESSKLFNNLIITLRNYTDIDLSIKSGVFQSLEVIMQELSKVSKETQIKALQNHDTSYTLVSITFETTIGLMPKNINCIVDPCKNC